MDTFPIMIHSTYSVGPLAMVAIALGLISFCSIFLVWHRSQSKVLRLMSVLWVILLEMGLLTFAGQHLPFFTNLAPQSYCFGDPTLVQYLLFLLPLLAAVFAFPTFKRKSTKVHENESGA